MNIFLAIFFLSNADINISIPDELRYHLAAGCIVIAVVFVVTFYLIQWYSKMDRY